MNIVKVPAKVVLSDNPVVFGVKTNNQYLSVGTQAKIRLMFGSVNHAPGQEFSFTFMGDTITFRSAVAPDNSGNQFRSAHSSDVISTWVSKIAEDLRNNYYLSTYYSITTGVTGIMIVAKENGSMYNISGQNLSVQNLSILEYPGSDTVTRPFFNIYAEILSGNKKIGSDLLPVDSSGAAYFDFSEYLRGISGANFNFPEQEILSLHSDGVKEFMVRFSEHYADGSVIPQFHKMLSTTNFFALPGGVSRMTQALYNENNTNFLQQLNYTHRFLSWRPLTRKTQASWMQKLWYLVHTSCLQVKVKVGLNYVVGTDPVVQSALLTKSVKPAALYSLFEINCGYNRLGIGADMNALPSGSILLSYDVFITDQDDSIISEIIRFEMDDRAYLNPRTFIFKNSFGLWETFTGTGDQVKEAEYQSVVINRSLSWNFTRSNSGNKKASVQETQKFTVNSGWTTREECDWIREMFLSTEVYEIVSGSLFPVVITGNKIAIHADNEYLHNCGLEYIHAYTDEHYSVPKVITKTLPHVVVDIVSRPISGSAPLQLLSTT